MAEVGSTGAIVARYPRGVNLIAREQDGALQYYLHNAHGDVTERTDNLGTVLRRYKYDAFGNEQNPEPLDSNPFRFCGEYFDAELGEVYLRARYYDPRTGRFGAEDSARDGLNWYTYCNENPILRVDPQGKDSYVLYEPLDDNDEKLELMKKELEKLHRTNFKNLPAIRELEGPALDKYMEHREDPDVLAKKSREMSEAAIGKYKTD